MLSIRRLVLSILVLLATWNQLIIDGLNVLTMGDSIDRNMITSWCTKQKSYGVHIMQDYEWGNGRTKFGADGEPYSHPSYWMCRTEANTSIAHSHFFGSRPAGPYYNNHRFYKYPHTDLVHSVTRMNITYEMYVSMFGHPDKILLAFTIWDISQLVHAETKEGFPRKNSLFWKKAQREYEFNLRARAVQALQLASTSNLTLGTTVWLRTTPINLVFNTLVEDFNQITRGVAQDLGLGLFDQDQFLYDMIEYDNSILLNQILDNPGTLPKDLSEAANLKVLYKDDIHVWPPFDAASADVLLEKTLSQWLTWPDRLKSSRLTPTATNHSCPLLYSCTAHCMDVYKGERDKMCECILTGELNLCLQECTGEIVGRVKDYVHGGCSEADTSIVGFLPDLSAPFNKLPEGNKFKGGMIGGRVIVDKMPVFKHGINVNLIAKDGVPITNYNELAEHAFLYDIKNHVRHSGITPNMLNMMKFGLGDLYRVTAEELHEIPEGHKFPANFDKCHVIQTHFDEEGQSASAVDKAFSVTYLRHLGRLHRIWDEKLLARLEGLMLASAKERRLQFAENHDHNANGEHHHHHSCKSMPMWVINSLPFAAFYWDASFPGPTPWHNKKDMYQQVREGEDNILFLDFVANIPDKKIFHNNSQVILKISGMHQVYNLQHGHRSNVNSMDEMVRMQRDWDDIVEVNFQTMNLICSVFICDSTKDGI